MDAWVSPQDKKAWLMTDWIYITLARAMVPILREYLQTPSVNWCWGSS